MHSTRHKLTPAAIAQPKVALNVPDQAYDHKTQRISGDSSVILATTWNATQTFNSQGKPTDKDNDK